jgi:mRNA interferase MazF
MKRGDVVTVVLPGAYGKPRPALIIQSDLFLDIPSVAVLPLTSELIDAPLVRIPVDPSPTNGLERPSHIMVDKPHTVPRKAVGRICGSIEPETLLRVNRALAVFLGFA